MAEFRSTEPHDRLTRLCDTMTKALTADQEYEGNEQVIVFLNDGENCGIQLHGYEDDMVAIVDLMIHMRAIFRANGKDLMIMPLNGGANS